MKGPWHPAGREWQKAIRTGVVEGIAGAEIQAADPATVGARWSTILGRPAESGGEGATRIRLDNAELRFVPDRDGRGEGLGGIDLVLADPNRTLPAEIGGVRLRGVAQ
jgi:hypothetical protein